MYSLPTSVRVCWFITLFNLSSVVNQNQIESEPTFYCFGDYQSIFQDSFSSFTSLNAKRIKTAKQEHEMLILRSVDCSAIPLSRPLLFFFLCVKCFFRKNTGLLPLPSLPVRPLPWKALSPSILQASTSLLLSQNLLFFPDVRNLSPLKIHKGLEMLSLPRGKARGCQNECGGEESHTRQS